MIAVLNVEDCLAVCISRSWLSSFRGLLSLLCGLDLLSMDASNCDLPSSAAPTSMMDQVFMACGDCHHRELDYVRWLLLGVQLGRTLLCLSVLATKLI